MKWKQTRERQVIIQSTAWEVIATPTHVMLIHVADIVDALWFSIWRRSSQHDENKIAKYADDSYLLLWSNHLSTAKSEFQHIQSWASRNNLCLNTSITKELIEYNRGDGNCRAPLEVIPRAARVTQMKFLGVTLSAELSMTLHLDETLVKCAASMVALRTFRSHGLPLDSWRKWPVQQLPPLWYMQLGGGLPWRVIGVGSKDLLGDWGDRAYLNKEAPTAAEMLKWGWGPLI